MISPSAPILADTDGKTGAYPGLSWRRYFDLDALNWHRIEPYRRSALHGRFCELSPRDATDSMIEGAAFHTAILEPDKFAGDYAVMPKFTGHANSTEHKKEKAAWLEQNKTKVPLSASDLEQVQAQARNVRNHPIANKLLDCRGRNELSIVWRSDGVLCKGRIDRICRVPMTVLNPNASVNEQALCLIDFKTSRAPGPDEFDRECGRYAYHGQLAFYHDGLVTLEPAAFVVLIVAVESSPPYDVVVHRLDETALTRGRNLYRDLLARYLQSNKKRIWPGMHSGVNTLVMPKWADGAAEEME